MEQQVLIEIRDLLREISDKLSYRKRPTKTVIECEFNLNEVYKIYPRKEGKTLGIERLAREIRTQEDYELLKLATRRYAEKCMREKTELKFTLLFSSFANRWRDYLPTEELKRPAQQQSKGLLI